MLTFKNKKCRKFGEIQHKESMKEVSFVTIEDVTYVCVILMCSILADFRNLSMEPQT